MAGKSEGSGQFPRGQVSPDDEGQLEMRLAADPVKKILILDFGKPVAWIGVPKKEALDLAELIKKRAEELPD